MTCERTQTDERTETDEIVLNEIILTEDELRALLEIRHAQARQYGEVVIAFRAGKLCKLETRLPADLKGPIKWPITLGPA